MAIIHSQHTLCNTREGERYVYTCACVRRGRKGEGKEVVCE